MRRWGHNGDLLGYIKKYSLHVLLKHETESKKERVMEELLDLLCAHFLHRVVVINILVYEA